MINRQFGLLGERLIHSYSPRIHSYLGDYDYKLFEVSPDNLGRFMSERAFDGINVTIPYKQAVMQYCDTISDEARIIGCVNTVIKDSGGKLHGYNTDYHGFKALLHHSGIDITNKKVLVLGDGGAAKTVRAALVNNADEIITISRRGNDNYDNINKHYDADIIINTTPVGMYPDNGSSPLSLKPFSKLSGVIDLIYNPYRTALMLEAESLAIAHSGGLVMLTAQAEQARRLFIEAPTPDNLAEKITGKLLTETLNIALIGMPGCGKSTAGRMLAKITGREFFDIDQCVEKAANKNIPQIFADIGETGFRGYETQVLSEISKKSGIVIATGGGVVTQDINLNLLRQNSYIVYLRRGLKDLSSSGRPLSQSIGVKELSKQRLPIYEAWCDCIVDVDSDSEVTAKKISEAVNENSCN